MQTGAYVVLDTHPMKPPVFRSLGFLEARAVAAVEEKWLIVEFSAEWCAPCRHMDRTTWVAPEVVAWLNMNAVAIQLDAESSPLSEELSVCAYPTVIAFKGEQEVSRTSGARPAPALLGWLGELETDRTESGSACEDLASKLSRARQFVEEKRDEEALELFAWLWEHSLEIQPSWVGVRSSFLIQALEPLLERSRNARARFRKLRNALAQPIDRNALHDFITLNQALGEEDLTLNWLRALVPADAEKLEIHMNHRLLTLIEQHREFALFGGLIKNGRAILEAHQHRFELVRASAPKDMPKKAIKEGLATFERYGRRLSALLLKSLRAAGREEEASSLAPLVKELSKPTKD